MQSAASKVDRPARQSVEIPSPGLMQDIFDEFQRRDPLFVAEQSLSVQAIPQLVERYMFHRHVQQLGEAAFIEVLQRGLDKLNRLGLKLDTSDVPDSLGEIVVDSLVDVIASDLGHLDLYPAPRATRPFDAEVSDRFDQHILTDGTRYIVTKDGDLPVFVLNACGLPLRLWHRLIADDHGLRLIFVESRAFHLVSGEMRSADGIQSDVADIVRVFGHEGIASAPVLSWCSGARVAAQLAADHAHLVQSLVFVAPTFRSQSGAFGAGSAFEEQLATIFNAVSQRPKVAGYFATAIKELSQSVDWPALAHEPALRALRFAGLPSKENVSALLQPMSTGAQLVHYGARMTSDMSEQDAETFARIEAPILLLTGDADEVVNNEMARSVLSHCQNGFVDARIRGAGHYIPDLQYSYLRSIVLPFLRGATLPGPTARLHIDEVTSL